MAQKTGRFQPGISGNPHGRPVKQGSKQVADQARFDGWQSSITMMGTVLDKRSSYRFAFLPVDASEAEAIYRGDDLGARAVEARPKEMFREGFDIVIADAESKGPGSARADRARLDATAAVAKDLSERALEMWRSLNGKPRFVEGLCYAAAQGGGLVLIGARDKAANWAEPLDLNSVRSLDFLTSLEAREAAPLTWYTDPLEPKFGEVKTWQLNPTSPAGGTTGVALVVVHESRLIHFMGIKTSRNQSSTYTGHGDSIFTRIKPVLRDFNIGFAALGIILNEFSLATMKIKGLAEMVSVDAQKKLFARMAAVQLGRSTANVTLIDSEEEFLRETASVAGLADVLERLMQRLAAALDMPVTVLMGVSPSGLNATGASDIRQWYDDIASEQEDIEPQLRRIFQIILRVLNGGKEPAKWSIAFRPLWQESAKECAETRSIDSQTDERNILNGVYTPDEVRRSRYGGDKYGSDIVIDDVEDGAKYDPAQVTEGETLGAVKPREIQKEAMNGAQIASLIQVIQAAVDKQIPRESAVAVLRLAFQIDEKDASDLLGPKEFMADKPEPVIPPNAPPNAPVPTGLPGPGEAAK